MYPLSALEKTSDTEFLYVGNHLALDFLNTRPRLGGEFTELLPDFSALVRWFESSALLESEAAAHTLRKWNHSSDAGKALRIMIDLREDLRKGVEAWEAGKAISRELMNRLNALMSDHPMLFRMKASRTELWFPTDHPADLLAPIAYSAARLFSDEDRSRVRRCEGCVLHFLDISKKGTRRWCSMQLCGNRAKVAAYAVRQRSS